jgi:hypothetical protein
LEPLTKLDIETRNTFWFWPTSMAEWCQYSIVGPMNCIMLKFRNQFFWKQLPGNCSIGFWALKLPRKSGSPDSEVSKSCSVENEGVDKSSLSSKSKNFRARKSVLLRGLDPPEILEETHTGMSVPSEM